eukprot:NODE_113_length_18482_cov_1.630746.p7 type:complete len:346 gc:universal NODE_113_length_18482_cov_1.630746:984-2021(+)
MKVVVIKVGTASVTNEIIQSLANVCKSLQNEGCMPIIVSSGAVGKGSELISFEHITLARKQALASIGQPRVMSMYWDIFQKHNLVVGQLLLGRNIINERSQYLNAKNTILELLKLKVVPIVNENDAVVVQELKFGDNDRLSAFVGEMIGAQTLFILTDVDGLYTENPSNPGATLIKKVESFSELNIKDLEKTGSSTSTGGMLTKLIAAEYATAAGIDVWILNASNSSRILDIMHNKDTIATLFTAKTKQTSRTWWIRNGLLSKGKLYLDDGAVNAIKNRANLFINGIIKTEGSFYADQAVDLCDCHGNNFAKGLINYSAKEIELLKQTPEEADIVIFRENIYIEN